MPEIEILVISYSRI